MKRKRFERGIAKFDASQYCSLEAALLLAFLLSGLFSPSGLALLHHHRCYDCHNNDHNDDPSRDKQRIRDSTASARRGNQCKVLNVFPLVFANAILSVSYAILSEAFLSFFGLSDPSKITWGLMLYNSYNFGGFSNNAYWFVLPPGICIILVVLGFTFASFALDEILNPRLRRR